MSFKEFVNVMNERGKSRFSFVKGYKFDKFVFRGAFFIMLLLLVVAFFLSGGLEEKVYVSCLYGGIGHSDCENPLYKNELYRGRVPDYLLNEETIPSGFELNRPPFVAEYFGEIIFLLTCGALLLNHFAYNRGYDFKKLFKQISEAVNRD
jgi:hypothetical protein